MLYLIGLGLSDERDISIKGLEIVKDCKHVYLENYTSILFSSSIDQMESAWKRPVILADREFVEMEADRILEQAVTESVALLVVGDPFGATTHSDLMIRAARKGVATKVIHNASIMNSIAECGLQLYSFGPTISIPFFTERWRPESFYHKLKLNIDSGYHTLCLLDIKVKEQSEENMLKGILVFEPPRYMTVNQALGQLSEIESNNQLSVLPPDRIVIGIARLGADDQVIAAGRAECIQQYEFGNPLHCLLIPGKMHDCEYELLSLLYCVDDSEAFKAAYLKHHYHK